MPDISDLILEAVPLKLDVDIPRDAPVFPTSLEVPQELARVTVTRPLVEPRLLPAAHRGCHPVARPAD